MHKLATCSPPSVPKRLTKRQMIALEDARYVAAWIAFQNKENELAKHPNIVAVLERVRAAGFDASFRYFRRSFYDLAFGVFDRRPETRRSFCLCVPSKFIGEPGFVENSVQPIFTGMEKLLKQAA